MKRNHRINPFEAETARYDAWFDALDGHLIFAQETNCLRNLLGKVQGRWLEVGVGTGRFAQALGISEGIDPSSAAISLAARRRILAAQGVGENLPHDDKSLNGVLLVMTICFLADPVKVLAECYRVLKNDGWLVVGHVPADSEWGKLYVRKGREGHPFYSNATFYTSEQVIRLAADAGFDPEGCCSCLFSPPGEPVADYPPQKGLVVGAGFAAIRFAKQPMTKKCELENREKLSLKRSASTGSGHARKKPLKLLRQLGKG